MEKKKSTKFKILFFIFLAIFVVGIIGIIIPFDFEDYSYSVKTSSISGTYPSYKIHIEIEISNSGDKKGYAVVQSEINYHFKGENEDVTVHSDPFVLKEGLNVITFDYTGDDWGSPLFKGVEDVKIFFDDDTSITIYSNPFFAKQNLAFFSCILIGFIAGAVTLILWKASGKVFVNPVEESFGNTIGNTINNTMKTFEERIKEAFKPVNEETKVKQNEKLTCSYCKCKFDGEKYDKCPHCGAPPEHKD